MATERTPINISSLSFDDLKQAIIDKIKGDPTFASYDFEGSGLNILSDILAHHLHTTSFLANMAGNEMFMDSAQLRESIVSKAKELGYTPRSKTASIAHIDITIENVTDSPVYLTVPSGTRFEGSGGVSFTTKDDYLLYPTNSPTNTIYSVENVEIFEGFLNEYSYTVDLTDPDQKFIIQSEYADTSTLKVEVKPSVSSSERNVYTLNNDITQLDEESEVYFLHQRPDGRYEVTFGDNVFGRAIQDGEVVILTYVITSGTEDYNGITTFTRLMPIDGYGIYDITTAIKSYNGSDNESTSSIRHAAPKNFEAQNRAVVAEDYETILVNRYPFIDSLNIWGGQDNDPPQYGKIFIAIKASHVDILSDNLKTEIADTVLKLYNTVTIVPEIVDPDILYVQLDGTVNYNPKNTTLSPAGIINTVRSTIESYFAATSEQFAKPFYYSPMLTAIDASLTAIENSLFSVYIQKRFVPNLASNEFRELKFGNAIVPGSISSTYYNLAGAGLTSGLSQKSQLVDDGAGTLYVINPDSGSTVVADVGTVNYTTGVLSLTLYVTDVPPDTKDIRITATPVKRNIIPSFNQIIQLDSGASWTTYNRKAGIAVEAISTYANI